MVIERTLSIIEPDAVARKTSSVHASDALETVAVEIDFFFPERVCERTH